MPSDLMNSEQFVSDQSIMTSVVKIKRISNTNNIGARMWFVFQDTNGNIYQKWSMLMDPTDEVLVLAVPGDVLDIEYWVETISDPVFKRIKSEFTRNNLSKGTFHESDSE